MSDTEFIQSKLDRLKGEGGVVYLPQGTYTVDQTIKLHSGTSLRGVRPSAMAKTGTWLKWVGKGDGPILDINSVQDCTIERVGLDGSHTPVTGICVCSMNTPSTWGIILREFAINRCANGILWGDPEFPEGQADHSLISDFSIWNSTGYGIKVNSANSLTCSEIRNGQLLNNVSGHIMLVRSGPMSISNCIAGGQNPSTFISMGGLSGCTNVKMCQCEGQAYFFYCNGHDDLYPVLFESCHINDPIAITGIKRVHGRGNYINTLVNLEHPGARWLSVEDRFYAGGRVEGKGSFMNMRLPFASAADDGAGRGEWVIK